LEKKKEDGLISSENNLFKFDKSNFSFGKKEDGSSIGSEINSPDKSSPGKPQYSFNSNLGGPLFSFAKKDDTGTGESEKSPEKPKTQFSFNYNFGSEKKDDTGVGSEKSSKTEISSDNKESSTTGGFKFNSSFSFNTGMFGKPLSGGENLFSTSKIPLFGQKPPIESETNNDETNGETNEETNQSNEKQFESTAPNGEEDEIVLFESKAKLYKFENNTWNNIAQGNLKINKNKNNNKCRIIMRKEGGLNLALNALIFPKMAITKQGDKSVIFPVVESITEEGESKNKLIQYVSRFPTAVDTENFYSKFLECTN